MKNLNLYLKLAIYIISICLYHVGSAVFSVFVLMSIYDITYSWATVTLVGVYCLVNTAMISRFLDVVLRNKLELEE